ncbi:MULTISPECIES: hypothetical protein [Cyanophyceae]|uniref:hypothetical protein n=1 Tax=Cyanophyceae TaxID=3028117 RepID=UPI001688961A|nr:MULTISPECIES: hypothetical protein [Cyanophyceae]MBD1917558.1 hypothetical protein [Phormidium sp. FACHB-77]MBD2029567.1 hypothetical protein [Phormidium sp. FACHB-322]MBD2050828.1 hypothetical protein [Leptolyngbya sp. FACHB-60]
MPQLTQGLIVAALIGLLLAVIVGYYLRQGRVNELTEALQQSQKRQEDLEKAHEQRLRTATQQLQKDYEAHLAEKMEQYEDRLEERRGQLESEYRTRESVMGSAPVDADSTTEQRIRKQYETRLKEAATKIQQAYEQHLQDKLVEARSQAQQDYDQRLAEAIAHYQDQEQTRQTQAPGDLSLGALVPEPTAAASTDTADVAEIEARLQAEYNQRLAEYEDDMAQRLAQMEQDYEARLQMAQASDSVPVDLAPSTAELELNLRRELEESLRAEYEQKLAEKIEHYQDELTQRTQDLEQAYEARLQLQVAPFPEPAAPVADEPAVDLDMAMLEEAMPPEAAISDEAALIADSEISLDMNEFSSAGPSPAVDEEDSDLATMLESEADRGQVDNWGLDADVDTDSLDINAFDTSEPDTISDLSELNFDDADEFSPEPTSPGSATGDFSLASLVESETDSGQIDDFGLEPEADTDSLDLNILLNQPASEPSSEFATDDFAPEAATAPDEDEFNLDDSFSTDSLDLNTLLNEPVSAPSSEFAVDELAFEAAPTPNESDFGRAGLLENETDSSQVDEFRLDDSFSTDSLDLNTLLNEPVSAPSSEFAMDELAFEAAPTPDESDFGQAGLLENETDSGQVDEFRLDDSFSADSLDLNALLNEPISAPSSEFAIDELAFEAAPTPDESDFGQAGLLENETDSSQVDEFRLDDSFSADSLDLNALLNEPISAPSSEFAVDEFAPETASSGLDDEDFGFAALLEGEADGDQVDEFSLDDDFNADDLDLDALLNPPAPEPTDDLLNDLDDLSNLS